MPELCIGLEQVLDDGRVDGGHAQTLLLGAGGWERKAGGTQISLLARTNIFEYVVSSIISLYVHYLL